MRASLYKAIPLKDEKEGSNWMLFRVFNGHSPSWINKDDQLNGITRTIKEPHFIELHSTQGRERESQ